MDEASRMMAGAFQNDDGLEIAREGKREDETSVCERELKMWKHGGIAVF